MNQHFVNLEFRIILGNISWMIFKGRNIILRVLININASSEILVDQRRVDVRSIRSVIQRKLAENPKGSVIISAHSEAKANTYAAVADAAQQAKEGIGITLVVKEE